MRRSSPAVIAAALAVLALGAAPVALGQDPGNGGIGPPESATPSGEAINQLYWFVFAICAVVFVAVEAALVLFVIRFRRRRSSTADETEGPQIHGNTRLEIIWTLIPAVILVGIAVVVLARSSAVEATSGNRANELVVEVQGHQFYWQYVYPEGQIAIDRLVLPVDRPVKLELVSFDVNHSWWVPELTGKRDAIPGRTNELRFTPTSEGVFEGRCAELCGVLHTVMPTTVEVVSQAEYEGRLQFLARPRSARRFPARPRARDLGPRLRQVPRACRGGRPRAADRPERHPDRRRSARRAARGRPGPPRQRGLHASGRARLAGVSGAGADRLHQVEPGAGAAAGREGQG